MAVLIYYCTYVILTYTLPDPVRMRRLYGDLGGANPLVRSRVLDRKDNHEFIQFGPALFIQKTNLSFATHTNLFVEEINKNFRCFISSTALVTANIGSGAGSREKSATTSYYSNMHWPLLHSTLRSGEVLHENSAVPPPHDAIGHVPKFWVGMLHLKLQTVMQNAKSKQISSQASSGGRRSARKHNSASFYSPGIQTTLDPGGDCHRRPIAVVSQAELDTILASDVCFIMEANNTYRRLECTKSGLHNKTTLHLGTTHVGPMSPPVFNAYMKHKKVMRPCATRAERIPGDTAAPFQTNCTSGLASGQTVTYAWNRTSLKFDAVPVRDELSLSRRVRISPIWNMLARLGAHAKGRGLFPKRVW